MSKGKRIFLTVVGIVAVIAVIVLLSKLLGGDDNFSEKYEGTNLETDGEFERDDTYAVYIKSHEDSARPQGEEIVVDLAKYDQATAENTEILTDYQGKYRSLSGRGRIYRMAGNDSGDRNVPCIY